jgi:hypothetical protein
VAVSWTSYEDLAGGGATSIFDSPTDVTIGSLGDDSDPLAGQVYVVAILGTTERMDVRFTDRNQGWEIGDSAGATGTDDQSNVVTLSGGAEIQRQEATV